MDCWIVKTVVCSRASGTKRQNRPVRCRGFDCRDNERWKVWSDYENKIVNPDLPESLNNGKHSP